MKKQIDITGMIGDQNPATSVPQWPMYSFSRPSYLLWDAVANGLHAGGWSEKKIREYLQSREVRYALDWDLGDRLEALGREFAEDLLAERRARP